MAGNKRFRAERLTSFEHDLALLKQPTIEKQEPFAAVLSCADSRVPVELAFDQSIGHIFVVRVAGADLSIRAKLPGFHDMPDELAEGTALEYAARYPGDDARHGGRLANRNTLALLRERGATL